MNLDPALLVLIGTLGATAMGLLGNLLQASIAARNENRRSLQRLALELAIKETDAQFEVLKATGGFVYPAVLSVHFNARILEAAARGELSPETWRGIILENRALCDMAESLSQEYTVRAVRRPGGQ